MNMNTWVKKKRLSENEKRDQTFGGRMMVTDQCFSSSLSILEEKHGFGLHLWEDHRLLKNNGLLWRSPTISDPENGSGPSQESYQEDSWLKSILWRLVSLEHPHFTWERMVKFRATWLVLDFHLSCSFGKVSASSFRLDLYRTIQTQYPASRPACCKGSINVSFYEFVKCCLGEELTKSLPGERWQSGFHRQCNIIMWARESPH